MSAYQPVLDPACGGRMFWFDKSDDRVLFGDVRDESWELCDGRRFDVKPDMLMDYRDLPFPDGTFRMVVLDPPHLRNAGETSYMAQKYGCNYLVCTKELCDEIVWQKMVPPRVNAILTPDSTGSKLILGHVQSYNDMSYRRRPASEILWAMVKANGKRTN